MQIARNFKDFKQNPKIAKSLKSLGKIFLPWFNLENKVEIL
jgi:hypothetical protein